MTTWCELMNYVGTTCSESTNHTLLILRQPLKRKEHTVLFPDRWLCVTPKPKGNKNQWRHLCWTRVTVDNISCVLYRRTVFWLWAINYGKNDIVYDIYVKIEYFCTAVLINSGTLVWNRFPPPRSVHHYEWRVRRPQPVSLSLCLITEDTPPEMVWLGTWMMLLISPLLGLLSAGFVTPNTVLLRYEVSNSDNSWVVLVKPQHRPVYRDMQMWWHVHWGCSAGRTAVSGRPSMWIVLPLNDSNGNISPLITFRGVHPLPFVIHSLWRVERQVYPFRTRNNLLKSNESCFKTHSLASISTRCVGRMLIEIPVSAHVWINAMKAI